MLRSVCWNKSVENRPLTMASTIPKKGHGEVVAMFFEKVDRTHSTSLDKKNTAVVGGNAFYVKTFALYLVSMELVSKLVNRLRPVKSYW